MKSLALLLGTLVALLVALPETATADKSARPNFVIFIADDMAWNDCGAYGHPKIQTPRLDQLARDGMRFQWAFLTCSSCSPSRSSVITGRYPHATGAAELHQPLPADQVAVTEPLRQAGYYTAAVGKWHLGPATIAKFDLVKQGGRDGAAQHWVPVLQKRPQNQPFFLWLASTDPHRGYQPNTIPQPHAPADVVVPPFLPDVPEVRADLALYYDEISRLDTYVGKVLDELDAQGVADNTFVLFFSDNGRPFPRCKTTVYDSGVRTPLLVRWPGHVKPGAVSESFVSTVDIAPTVLELAGLKSLPSFQGKSFAPILHNPRASIRKYAYAEHNWHDYRAFERGVRSQRYQYVFNAVPKLNASPPADAVNSPTYAAMQRLRDAGSLPPEQMGCFVTPRPAEELYDVQADPYTLNNLAGNPKYAKVLDQMRSVLAQWKKETGDVQPANLTPDKFDRETGKRL